MQIFFNLDESHSLHSTLNVKSQSNHNVHFQSDRPDGDNELNENTNTSFNKSVQMNLSYHEYSMNNSNNNADVVLNTNTIQKLGNKCFLLPDFVGCY